MPRNYVAVHEGLLKALRDAGLCDDDTSRVVIDIKAGCIPVIYTEKFANPDRDLLSVVTALGGVQVEIRKAEEGGQ
ncbi:hypothetical protein HD597_011310 [Nonomuraea thailandensis]|uniref:Uncharacterized protein n=1 Tax=Nonomuraea thailandensis TaxID=1188745 RepID=A0A9X2GUN0_9ACTN|nr:hypothetical protein [Nonomuraea thailandensis]MCP2364290.1 hypothetical protein [Nonomuraea thailandensis]